MNLLFNAIDAMQQSGTIRITTWGADDWAHCSVADTGVGMSDEVRAHAIEPFFTTKGPRGTGLGLSVSHSVMQRHGGELSLRPNEGGGTVVTLRLPRAVALEPAKVEPAPRRRAAAHPPGRRRAHRSRGSRRHAGGGRPRRGPGAQRPRGPRAPGRGHAGGPRLHRSRHAGDDRLGRRPRHPSALARAPGRPRHRLGGRARDERRRAPRRGLRAGQALHRRDPALRSGRRPGL